MSNARVRTVVDDLQPPTTADLVLLCSFEVDAGDQTYAQLRANLLGAGFRGAAIGHLVRSSPAVQRVQGDVYRLPDPPRPATRRNQAGPAFTDFE